MTRRISIPLVIDLLIVNDADQIAMLDAHPAVTRDFGKSRSWAVRWLGTRFRNVLSIGNTLLPAILPREDCIRQGQTAALERRFGSRGENATITPEDVHALACYVRGEVSETVMMARLQCVVGRQFGVDYQATSQTVHDAFLLDTAARNFLKGLWWRVTGQIGPARLRMAQACDGDIYAAHATVVALHSLVVPLRALSQHFTQFAGQSRGAAEIVAGVIEPPPRSLRSVSGPVEAPFLSWPLGTKSLVIFAPPPSAGVDVAFAMGRWSRCPAHAFVRRLLEDVWRAAIAAPAENSSAAPEREPVADRAVCVGV
jgi:hypothetical protein